MPGKPQETLSGLELRGLYFYLLNFLRWESQYLAKDGLKLLGLNNSQPTRYRDYIHKPSHRVNDRNLNMLRDVKL